MQGIAEFRGLYDWTNRLLTTVDTDYNGLFEVLMPSTNSYNWPVPAGPCAGMYRFVGNDPGQPQHPNMNYKPIYRTIAANFQAWPGIFTAADTARPEPRSRSKARPSVCRGDRLQGRDTSRNCSGSMAVPAQPEHFNATNTETTGTIKSTATASVAHEGRVTLTKESGAATS